MIVYESGERSLGISRLLSRDDVRAPFGDRGKGFSWTIYGRDANVTRVAVRGNPVTSAPTIERRQNERTNVGHAAYRFSHRSYLPLSRWTRQQFTRGALSVLPIQTYSSVDKKHWRATSASEHVGSLRYGAEERTKRNYAADLARVFDEKRSREGSRRCPENTTMRQIESKGL